MISIKTEKEIEIMKEGGKILAEILRKLSEKVKPGITTWSLEELARELIKQYPDIEPAFLGYNGYPAALCVSINEEIVHCLPSERKIMKGDLVSLDFGIRYKELNIDSATTILAQLERCQEPFLQKTVPDTFFPDTFFLKKKLIKTTKECLDKGIEAARIGNTIGDISFTIQNHAEKNGFSVIRDLVGHGIGRELHEDPEVPNFGAPGRGPKLKEGMVIAIEPMLSVGSYEVIEDKKTLAWKTKDNSLSAHFEHTIAITKDGPLILTE